MTVMGRAESWLLNNLSDVGLQPSLRHGEAPATVTWQLILAAQQADAIVSYYTRRIRGQDVEEAVNTDELDPV